MSEYLGNLRYLTKGDNCTENSSEHEHFIIYGEQAKFLFDKKPRHMSVNSNGSLMPFGQTNMSKPLSKF